MWGLISMPSPSDVIGVVSTTNDAASTGAIAWTSQMLGEFWILPGVAVGLLVVGLVIRFVMRNVKGGVKNAFGSRKFIRK